MALTLFPTWSAVALAETRAQHSCRVCNVDASGLSGGRGSWLASVLCWGAHRVEKKPLCEGLSSLVMPS